MIFQYIIYNMMVMIQFSIFIFTFRYSDMYFKNIEKANIEKAFMNIGKLITNIENMKNEYCEMNDVYRKRKVN